jgi:hypothetical protein
MAVNFGILAQTPSIGARYMEGLQMRQADAERNMLRQAQVEQMAMQRENMLAQRQAQAEQRQERNLLAQQRGAQETRAAQTAELEREIKTVDLASRLLYGATPETYPSIRERLSALNPQFGASLPPEYNEAQVKALAMQGRSVKEQIEAALGRQRYMSTPYGPFDIEAGEYRMPPTLPPRAPTPGAAAPAPAAPKAPVGYRFTDSGNLEAIPGGPATRAPAARGGATAGGKPAEPAGKPAHVTEQQASTATQRLLRRAQEISTVLSANKKAEAPTALEAGMENVPLLSRATNLVRSTDRQIVSSAQDDILDALLYLSTGAAYNKEQLAQQKSAYLPSWSDDPPTRQVKRQRLTQAIEGARVRAGRAWSPELDAAMQQLLASPVMGAAAPAAGAPPTGARPSLDSIFK